MRSNVRKRYALRSDLMVLLLLSFVHGAMGEIDVAVNIPIAVAENSTVNMTCSYNLYNNPLYSVKWYKGRNEFFRFIPKEMPPIIVFQPFSNKININQSSSRNVVIDNVPLDFAGRYGCEVSTDSPNFYTRMESGYMNIARLPEGKVKLSVEKPRYAVGDTVRGNCTAPPGYPPANVTWTINGHPVNSYYKKNPLMLDKTDNSAMLRSTVAGLEYDINGFKNGRLHIACHANVFQLYNETAEISLDEERPRLASVLGTRESNSVGSASQTASLWLNAFILFDALSCILR